MEEVLGDIPTLSISRTLKSLNFTLFASWQASLLEFHARQDTPELEVKSINIQQAAGPSCSCQFPMGSKSLVSLEECVHTRLVCDIAGEP